MNDDRSVCIHYNAGMEPKMTTHSSKITDQWSSKFAFIIAATGAAVGLGNVWRFPYMTGTHGGSAFVLVYILCVIIIGLPIMIAELLIGRRARQNPVTALQNLALEAGASRHWGLLGWFGALALIMVLSFYSVVSGWSIAYITHSLSGDFHNLNPTQITGLWNNFLSNPWRLLFYHTFFMCLTIGVIIKGVEKGLERATKILMPALYIILIGLVIYAAIIGDFSQGFHFLFDFDSSKITTTVVIAAMGHAFFTLALGAGAMLMYGAYVPRGVNLVQCVLIVSVLDVLVAFLSGLAIFPIVFADHLAPNSGPGLMFVSLPITFAHMKGGNIVGGLFFLLLLFAAWTASINLAEPLVNITMKHLQWGRTRSALLIGFIAWFLGIGSLLSFNVWKHVQFFHEYSVFDVATNVPTDFILPLGGLGFAIFAGWIMKKSVTQTEVPKAAYPLWRFLVRYIATAGIIVVFISSLIG